MNKVARLPAAERLDLFQETATQRGVSAAVIEKDFWVCWVLKQLFADAALGTRLVFKGGTSLSKVYNLIDRFSEDIDLILDWRLLGYGPDQRGSRPACVLSNLLPSGLRDQAQRNHRHVLHYGQFFLNVNKTMQNLRCWRVGNGQYISAEFRLVNTQRLKPFTCRRMSISWMGDPHLKNLRSDVIYGVMFAYIPCYILESRSQIRIDLPCI